MFVLWRLCVRVRVRVLGRFVVRLRTGSARSLSGRGGSLFLRFPPSHHLSLFPLLRVRRCLATVAST